MAIPQELLKAHGTGNDFVAYIDAEGTYEPTEAETIWLCDRHRGIGGDGLLRLTHPGCVSDLTTAQVRAMQAAGAQWFMDYRNADGSLAEMCGNGTRVMALLAEQAGLSRSGEPFLLGTRAGVKHITALPDDPVLGSHVFQVNMGPWRCDAAGGYVVSIPGTPGSARGTFVDVGNPHVVSVIEGLGELSGLDQLSVFDDSNGQFAPSTLPAVAKLDLTHKPVVSPLLQSDQNAEFVRVDEIDTTLGRGRAFMRVNERGVGETLSCGTGLCATGVVLYRLTGVPHWAITVLGGTLRVDVTDADVTLTGSATVVATVELN